MTDHYQYAFGKLNHNEIGEITGEHPLVDHLIDVAACFESLCQCHAIRRALEQAAGRSLDSGDIARLSVLVFLHDIGKANSGFQAKRWQKWQDIPKRWGVLVHAGHGSEALKLFEPELESLLMLLPIEQMDSWGEACYSLLVASISHHGRPIKDPPPDSLFWTKPSPLYNPADTLKEIGDCALTLYPQAFQTSEQLLPDAPAFGHLFAGLVQLADWLGSDTKFFPFSAAGEDRASTAKQKARRAIVALGLDAEDWRAQLETRNPSFNDIFQNPPRPIQSAMRDSDSALGNLVILESETGSGKTEAALWRFVDLFKAGKVDSLYFALPTRVAATQVYERVHAAVQKLWANHPPLTVRALSGYVSADGETAQSLPDFKVFWSDEPSDEQAERRWAAESSKRFLAAPIAVGTIDQALLGALQVRHAHLRHALLARSLLVVDEVHASDAYMTTLLQHLLKAHLNNGGHALLLSATLGSSARNRYLQLPSDISFDDARAVPYPAISDCHQVRAVAQTGNTKKVHWTAYDIIHSPEQIADKAIAAAQQGAKVLVIRNTVPAAIATFNAIEAKSPERLFTVNGIRTLHHSRFSREDRPVMDKAVETALGKNRPAGGCIVVGTQTLEQSLDIDADVLLTDLCPMDVLLQRVGRLHRHLRAANERPAAFQTAQAWIFTPAGHDLNPLIAKSQHGLGMFHDGGGIYPDLRILEATRALLLEKPEVSIPDNNRYLVEAATHPDKLQTIEATQGDAWKKLGQKMAGGTGAQNTIAHLHALDVSQVFGEQTFPDDVKIATRLGAQDWIARFNLELPSPFGIPLKALPIRHYLLPKNLSLDTEPSDIQQTSTSLLFRLGTANLLFRLGTAKFRYTRLGLELLKDE
ncbi:MAG: CRISPR-associated helicase Cas3' [Gallionella sp.]